MHPIEDGSPSAVEQGDADVNVIDGYGIRQSYNIVAREDSVITFRPLYFPGWTVRMGGEPVELRPSENGNIQLAVPPGEHNLELRFEDTRPRAWGKRLSIASLAALAAILLIAAKTSRRAHSGS
jgi:hypothetical protein